jgi:hypothetical protein
VVNLTRPAELDEQARQAALEGRLSREDVASDLSKAGVDVTDELVDGLLDEARAYAERRALEDRQRERIDRLDVPAYTLERLPDGIDLGGLYELAEDLREQGMA